ncbi:FAD-dependent oxidoreductase [Rhizorhabdus histidinilytica]
MLAEVSRLEGLYTETLGNNKVEIIRERATVAGPHEVLLGSGQTITAGKILIATGAWPIVPHFPGPSMASPRMKCSISIPSPSAW